MYAHRCLAATLHCAAGQRHTAKLMTGESDHARHTYAAQATRAWRSSMMLERQLVAGAALHAKPSLLALGAPVSPASQPTEQHPCPQAKIRHSPHARPHLLLWLAGRARFGGARPLGLAAFAVVGRLPLGRLGRRRPRLLRYLPPQGSRGCELTRARSLAKQDCMRKCKTQSTSRTQSTHLGLHAYTLQIPSRTVRCRLISHSALILTHLMLIATSSNCLG